MRAIALSCLFALALSATAFSSAVFGADAPGAGPALVKERCTRCHTLGRVQRNVESKRDQAWWSATVERMQNHGAKLSADEKGALTGFLATQATSKDF